MSSQSSSSLSRPVFRSNLVGFLPELSWAKNERRGRLGLESVSRSSSGPKGHPYRFLYLAKPNSSKKQCSPSSAIYHGLGIPLPFGLIGTSRSSSVRSCRLALSDLRDD